MVTRGRAHHESTTVQQECAIDNDVAAEVCDNMRGSLSEGAASTPAPKRPKKALATPAKEPSEDDKKLAEAESAKSNSERPPCWAKAGRAASPP